MMLTNGSPGHPAGGAKTSLQNRRNNSKSLTAPGNATADLEHSRHPESRGSGGRVIFIFEIVCRKLDEYFVVVDKAEDAGEKFLRLVIRILIALLFFASSAYLLFWLVQAVLALTAGGGR